MTAAQISKPYANTSAASRAARSFLGHTAILHGDFHLIPVRGGKYRWAPGPDPKKAAPRAAKKPARKGAK